MSVSETLTIMISFGSLIATIILGLVTIMITITLTKKK